MVQTSRKIKGVIIHCSATHPNWRVGDSVNAKRDEVARWHTDPKPNGRGWRAIGYDFLSDRDGSEAIGRDLDGDNIAFEDVGAHTAGYNSDYVSLMLFGGAGSAATDQFYDNFTQAQENWLIKKIRYLQKRFGANIEIRGHNEFSAKACPGFNVPAWWQTVLNREAPSLVQHQAFVEPAVVPRKVPSKDLRGQGRPLFKLETIRGQIAQWFGALVGLLAGLRGVWTEADPTVQIALIVALVVIIWIAVRYGGRVFIDRLMYFTRGLD